ncbi:MAG: hypothetical protein IAF94_14465 [Pirellulaceae bacterium]|nr:hypothetical protein [Pirellulaceae bacterium]
MDPAPKRPWYRLHWLTVAVCSVVLGAVVFREMEQNEQGRGHGTNDFGPISFVEYESGWPLRHRYVWIDFTTLPSGIPATSTLGHLMPWALTVNVLLGLILVMSAMITVEHRCRTVKLWQVTLREMLVVTAILALLLWLAMEEERLLFPLSKSGTDVAFLHEPHDFSRPLLGLVYPHRWPILFGLGCTVYLLGWLTCHLATRAWSLLRGK